MRTKVFSIIFAKIIRGATNLLLLIPTLLVLEKLREKRLVSKLVHQINKLGGWLNWWRVDESIVFLVFFQLIWLIICVICGKKNWALKWLIISHSDKKNNVVSSFNGQKCLHHCSNSFFL